MYKVIHKFADAQDKNYIYEIGDTYPREGKKVSKERLAELASDTNKVRMPLIEAVAKAESVPEPEVEEIIDEQPKTEEQAE